MRTLRAPLSEDDVRFLELGEVVFLDGPVVTCRDEAHARALELLRAGEPVPECLRGAALYHCGPIMARDGDGWEVVAAGPTTSARMDAMEPEMIRSLGLRAVIGKGGMSAEVSAQMRETGCVYLSATGGAAVMLAEGLHRVRGVEWEDLGMAEAVWRFDADRFGPLVVSMDARGGSLYEDVRRSLARRRPHRGPRSSSPCPGFSSSS